MNWGKGIVMGMIVFMLFIISMCVYMFMMPADEYDHQYYEKGLNFDKDFNKEKQVDIDHAQPIISLTAQAVKINFVAAATGTAIFLRPSNKEMDKEFKLSGNQEEDIPIAHLAHGRWQIQLEWESNHKAYLYLQEIYIK